MATFMTEWSFKFRILACVFLATRIKSISLGEFEQTRADILRKEISLTVGGNLVLSQNETIANEILMEAKYKEVDDGFEDIEKFNPARHFFVRKPQIEQSSVFKIIKKMPKGAALHVHDTALIGTDYIIKNITYRDHLYICVTSETNISFQFSISPPITVDCKWQLLHEVRKNDPNIEEFDKKLAKLFTMEVSDPKKEYVDINDIWIKFIAVFIRLFSLLTYKPVWEDYFYEALRQFREDNILYVELRATLPNLYDLNGRVYDSVECATIYKNVNDRFKVDYPDSFGARIIYAPVRLASIKDVQHYLEILNQIKGNLGDFIAGFDLVGQEDLGKPLIEFIPELLKIPKDIHVFYHAGETNWFGTTSDFNLLDAVLLNAKRLGHAYALIKHPAVANIVKEKQIAIEVNPLSNQILMLVDDMRNHPASVMIADNFPVVISSDDPGLWGALPLSHDMYETFIGLTSRHTDIRLLKQLAMNSIIFSSMREEEKLEALTSFNKQWNLFISEIVRTPSVILK